LERLKLQSVAQLKAIKQQNRIETKKENRERYAETKKNYYYYLPQIAKILGVKNKI